MVASSFPPLAAVGLFTPPSTAPLDTTTSSPIVAAAAAGVLVPLVVVGIGAVLVIAVALLWNRCVCACVRACVHVSLCVLFSYIHVIV